MAITVADPLDQAAALLNDPSRTTFTYADMLPYFKIAWRELQTFLVSNGITDVDEYTTTALTISADTKEWTNTPIDLLFPIKMWERAVGESVDDWVEMDERIPDPSEAQETELEIWYFKEGNIWFRGANSIREVILRYQRELTAIVSENTAIPVRGSISFLAFRTAGIIARVRGNKGRANDLDADAKMYLDSTVAAKVKDMQGDPVRPRRYGYTRRMLRMTRLI